MKKSIATLALVLISVFSLVGQEFRTITNPEIIEVINYGETAALRDFDHSRKFEDPRVKPEKLGYVPKKDWKLNTYVQDKLHTDFDPAYQTEGPIHQVSQAKALDKTYDGMGYSGVNPSDNILDVGPNHVIQMINGSSGAYFIIYDKDGNVLVNQTYLDNFFSSNGGASYSGLGDPIVLYDAMADRWFMAEFQSGGNNIYMAVSTSPDPTGSWYFYSFLAPNFPDYLKFGVWSDMYIMTSNESGDNPIYAIDRTAMLAGTNPTTQRFTVPTYGSIGFQATTPVTHDGGNAPPAGAPGMFMRMGDDAWTGGPAQDQLELWSMDIDFANSANSVVSGPQLIPVSAFDTELCGYTSFSCIDQPGTNTQLDPLREVLMNRVQYRNLGTHEAIVSCHSVDVSGADESGVRWYENRRVGGVANSWTLHQEGTYAPDTDSRWMSGIAMNAAGDIAIMYNISSSSTFPGIRYTGRYANDPLGQMTIAETTIVDGSASNASNRYGDYNSLDSDPVTGSFWGTANYNPTTSWATRIAEFSFPPLNCTAPTVTTSIVDDCGNMEFDLSVNIGADGDATGYNVFYTVNGGSAVSLGTLQPGIFTISDIVFSDVVDVTIAHNEESACDQTISGFTSTGVTCCAAPTLSASTTPDCANALFNVSLTIGADGDAADYDVYVNDGSGSALHGTYAAGTIDLGDFALGSVLSIDVEHNGYPLACNQTLSGITVSSICNDDCSGAEAISCGTVVSGSTVGATVESPDPGLCGTTAGAAGGVWYTFIGQNSDNPSAAAGTTGDDIVLSHCENGGTVDYDSKIRVFSGTCGSLTCVTGDDDDCTGTSALAEFTSVVGETYFVLVHGYSLNTGSFSMYFGCTAPPTCLEPSGQNVTNITQSTATLGWTEVGTATSWNIEYGVSGFTPTGTPSVSGHALPTFDWSGGQASSAYDFYVQSDCGPGDLSVWVGPFTWTTSNAGISTPQGVICTSSGSAIINLLTEDFEGGAIGWTGDITSSNTNGDWEIPNGSGSSATGPDGAYSGTFFTNYEASGPTSETAELISPLVDLSAVGEEAELSFYMHAYGLGMGTLDVGVSNSISGPWSTEFTWTGPLQTAESDSWQGVGVDLTSYIGQLVYIRFAHTGAGNFEGDMSLDYIKVDACSDPNACLQPVNGNTSSIGATQADLSWQELGSAAAWDVELGLSGFSPAGMPTATVSSESYTATGLLQNTAYDFYARSDCGAGNYSVWNGPFSFTTLIDYCIEGQFYDNGGVSGTYSPSSNDVIVICPNDPSETLEVTFTYFRVEDRTGNTVCWDELVIYDGPSTASALISPATLGLGPNTTGGFCWDPIDNTGTGDLTGQALTSTDASGCLTFSFVSDASVHWEGWEATVSCVSATCVGDFVPNGIVDIDDFLAFNTAYGTSCIGCPEDMNSDGVVNIDDFLEFNTVYGTTCPLQLGPGSDLQSVINPQLADDLRGLVADVRPALLDVIEKLNSEADMFVYPNPNQGELINLVLKNEQLSGEVSILIKDVSGKTHYLELLSVPSGSKQIALNMKSKLASGVYFLVLNDGQGQLVERFVVD